jgi:uncharacterized protein (TIGR02145 family)
MNGQLQKIALILALLGFWLSGAAQVTIGSGLEPTKGALLDLKDHNPLGSDQTTASKGLLLPRVSLTNLNRLYPMLPLSYNTAEEDELHIGLQVYNVNTTSPFCPGVYIWEGQQWQRISAPCKYTYQCGSGTYPTMSLWAELAGFLNVPENQTLSDAQEIATLKRDDPDPTTGIAWHRDQDGNIFLSASFDATDITGDTERWMITNLAATSYATGSRTGTDATVSAPLPASPSIASDNVNPLWAYPNNGTTPTTYTNNPRLGLLYSWPAATNSRTATINEAENPSTPNVDPQTAKIQGICPNGWYLPSDREWTYLEQEISSNTSRYSSLPNAGTTIDLGQQAGRGTIHGAAMKEECEPYNIFDPATQGKSNTITTAKRPGFEALLAGLASGGSAYQYGSNGYWWSASRGSSASAWSRVVLSGDSQVGHYAFARSSLFSVRCKKG